MRSPIRLTAIEGGAGGSAEAARAAAIDSPLREIVTSELRAAILAGRYKPGQRLIEDRLAADFGVSRNPVREALRSLAAEGLVLLTARRGATVAAPSAEDAREMIEVRATLEGLNARHAARRRDPAVIALLSEVLRQGTEAAAGGALDALPDLNARFHDALAAAGSNRVLGDLMRSLRLRTGTVFAPLGAWRARETWEEHAAILKAVIAGDEALSALLAERHVMRAGDDFMRSTGEAEAGAAAAAAES
jgi:DNA-binding GntR family transcriptional regulator